MEGSVRNTTRMVAHRPSPANPRAIWFLPEPGGMGTMRRDFPTIPLPRMNPAFARFHPTMGAGGAAAQERP